MNIFDVLVYIGIIILVVVIVVLVIKLVYWFIDFSYHYSHPEVKRLNKKLLKSYLINKHGKTGKNVYKNIVKELWEKYKIR